MNNKSLNNQWRLTKDIIIKNMNMKTQFNEVSHKHEWIIDRWYQKTIYVVAVIYTALLAVAFLVGFVSGVLN